MTSGSGADRTTTAKSIGRPSAADMRVTTSGRRRLSSRFADDLVGRGEQHRLLDHADRADTADPGPVVRRQPFLLAEFVLWWRPTPRDCGVLRPGVLFRHYLQLLGIRHGGPFGRGRPVGQRNFPPAAHETADHQPATTSIDRAAGLHSFIHRLCTAQPGRALRQVVERRMSTLVRGRR